MGTSEVVAGAGIESCATPVVQHLVTTPLITQHVGVAPQLLRAFSKPPKYHKTWAGVLGFELRHLGIGCSWILASEKLCFGSNPTKPTGTCSQELDPVLIMEQPSLGSQLPEPWESKEMPTWGYSGMPQVPWKMTVT